MKKLLVSFLLFTCLLTGCFIQSENKTQKMCRVEIYTADHICTAVLEEQTQEDIGIFFDLIDAEILIDTSTTTFVPPQNTEYIIAIYQEKTPSLLHDSSADTYEKIMEYTTYKDSQIIKGVICEETIKSETIPETFLTFYCNGSEPFFAALTSYINQN